ncbi:MAG: GTPase Era [Bacteroidia bacterium]
MKAGFIGLIGLPNSGKSTFLNRLIGYGLAAITPKPQTTRFRIYGILHRPQAQMIFVDTPGYTRPTVKWHQALNQQVHKTLQDADVALWVHDIKRNPTQLHGLENLLQTAPCPILAAINKIDLHPSEDKIRYREKLLSLYPIKEVFFLSALTGEGVETLLEGILPYLPESPPLYDESLFTPQQERFFVAEIIRKQLYLHLEQEVPYSSEVVIEEFREAETHHKKKDYVRATLYVEKQSQKAILIGAKGEKIKHISMAARKEIEEFLQREVFLELRVKVWKNWRQQPRALRYLKYPTF